MDVRTTIEIRPEHRAKLLEIAARRGEKGFSSVVADAIDSYLANLRDRTREQALNVRGKLGKRDAQRLRKRAASLRESWR